MVLCRISKVSPSRIPNKEFRRWLYTAKHCQLVVMALKPWEEIGAEVHKLGMERAYAAAAAKGPGSENLSQVAHAAMSGHVATLLIEAERQEVGRIDRAHKSFRTRQLARGRRARRLGHAGQEDGRTGPCRPNTCLAAPAWRRAFVTDLSPLLFD